MAPPAKIAPPATLPADFFDKQGAAAPSTLPGDFFDKKEASVPPQPEPPLLQRAMSAVGDVGVGALKGAASTANNLGHIIYPDWLAKHLTGDPSAEQQENYFAPTNTAQSIGKGAEQVGEFLLPGGAEERGAAKLAEFAPKLGKMAEPLARVLTSATSGGAVNKAQGGDFTTGAAMSGAGAGAAQALKAGAPTLTGIAQGLDPADYAKSGKAILNETSGIFPGQVRKSAGKVLDKLNPELNAVADNSPAKIPMDSARTVANEQLGRAMGQNNPKMTKGVKRMANQLFEQTHEPVLGAEGPSATLPIPDEVPASQYLELKRGVGKALPAGSWNPESSNAFKGPRNAIYGKMANDFEDYVPEAKPLNQRISALIPATEKPKNFFFGHALGPGVGATLGGVGGYRREGIPGAFTGALEGGMAGFAIPTMLNSAARIANSPALQRVVIPALSGSTLQATRNKKEQ